MSPRPTRPRPPSRPRIGIGLATVGVDTQTGVPRFTFGEVHLYDGIDFLVAIVGLFALSEVFLFLEHRHGNVGRQPATRFPSEG